MEAGNTEHLKKRLEIVQKEIEEIKEELELHQDFKDYYIKRLIELGVNPYEEHTNIK